MPEFNLDIKPFGPSAILINWPQEIDESILDSYADTAEIPGDDAEEVVSEEVTEGETTPVEEAPEDSEEVKGRGLGRDVRASKQS